MKVSTAPDKGFYTDRDIVKLAIALKQAEKLMDEARNEISKVNRRFIYILIT